jgi:phosphoglycerol transferase MdoB-like AlkP superfamily enzyme
MFRYDFNLDSFIQWLHVDTKRFVLYFLILLVLFLLTSKYQFRTFESIKTRSAAIVKVLQYILIFAILFFFSIIVNVYFQYFQQLMNSQATVTWIVENTRIFFAGVLYLFFLFLLLFALIGNVYIGSLLTSFVLIAIGYVHFNKLNLRGEPLYPSDFNEFSQLKEVIPMVSKYISITDIILVVVLFLVLGVIVFFLPKIKVSLLGRAIILVLSIIMVYSFTYFPRTFMSSFAKDMKISVVEWDQLDNYNVNGFLFGFISNLQYDSFKKPAGYSKQAVLAIAKKYANLTNEKATEPKVTPNIVFIMSESFWDPTRLSLQFSGDPMSHIRQLMSQQTSGYSLSPTFGGGTANVEFEALTGFSTSFIQPGSIPYQDLVDRKPFIPTIVSDLESKGYDTLALHPYIPTFYKRDIVYKTFGFNQFISQDTMKNKERDPDGIINDYAVTKEILGDLKSDKKPLFMHVVTMQNHMPYNPGRYPENQIKVSGLTPDSESALEVYSEGIRRSDEAFQQLVDGLNQLKEPTIVVFWGDHMPILGANLSVYKEAGYQNKNPQINERMYSETPLLMYSNYGTKAEKLNTVSPFYFSPIVYDLTGLKKPPFYTLLEELRQQIPALKGKNYIGSDQQYLKNLTKKQKQLLSDYQMLEYDLLVGKQYSLQVLYPNNKK